MEAPEPQYLLPTAIIDSDHPDIVAYAKEVTKGAAGPLEKAIELYYAVRDGIRYDPYYPFYKPEHYRASNVLRGKRGFCIPKLSLLCALARACGIPSRAGFATVRNHLATRQLLEFLGSDLFPYHGFAELYLEGKWVKATPAFNKELCERHGVAPLEFDGQNDSIFQSYTADAKKFMDYIAFQGTAADIPVDDIVASWEAQYGRDRVQGWIRNHEESGDIRRRDFQAEEVVTV
jgi:transglutaminase-like putative cysteine protease